MGTETESCFIKADPAEFFDVFQALVLHGFRNVGE
jgi:hypothetical protein